MREELNEEVESFLVGLGAAFVIFALLVLLLLALLLGRRDVFTVLLDLEDDEEETLITIPM